MQGLVKVEVKIDADGREYNFFFPSQANIHEVISVCEKLLDGFKEALENSNEQNKENVPDVSAESKDSE